MELQLGLSLIPAKPFDLNNSLLLHDTASCLDLNSTIRKKRPLHVDPSLAFRRTLPLLLWNDHPNNGDDDDNDPHSASNDSDEEEEEEDNRLVGWPPLKKRKTRSLMQKRRGRGRPAVNGGGLNWNSNSRYVKVKMEGVGIGRKVDLSQYHCFDELRATLMKMFGYLETDEMDPDGQRLTYQDIDGDWLLADDVTWRNFIGTVQRIKLEKNRG
ncbi:auxin-responsive protein IAA29-like [Cucurbita moschata]|uniref:Auxin-responsive protein n=1 Tax=Cucurbita moschata TaxID=3662 RepID=A0A6J1F6G3_CUCMO|nr:auxin-responsive protein IAA29-like [Cucurbita moschata]